MTRGSPFVPTLTPLGDRAVRVGFEAGDAASDVVTAWCARLSDREIPGVEEWVPSMTAVAVFYDPLVIGFAALCALLRGVIAPEELRDAPAARRVVLPVRYGGVDGPDLGLVARHAGMTEAEVIRRHCAGIYRVTMIGFTPGFPYLSGLDPALATPRLDTPRPRVPAGSVGIGGEQTGVYPMESPGGWRLIGRTAARLFDPHRIPVSLLSPGDGVRFVPAEGGP